MTEAARDDIPFNRDFPLPHGRIEEVLPGIRRMVVNNPSPFTFTGTVTYIVGRGEVAIIDPGPVNDAHFDTLMSALAGERITHIFVTHTHRDHSPGAARLKAATGAKVYAEGPHRAARPALAGEASGMEAGGDVDFHPDVRLRDFDRVMGAGWTLEAVATPGHTMNHLAFAWPEKSALFVGDHVMGWSTSIVAPPDGAMAEYMASLEKLLSRAEDIYFPGHGPHIPDARRFVQFYIAHRKAREASILHRLAKGEADIPTLVRAIYIGLDERLVPAAGLSVFAHLEDMAARGAVATHGAPQLTGTYRLA
jgi:glyoxylase-like metal-dependent hydrolase (beta-lactamase superfamily II)